MEIKKERVVNYFIGSDCEWLVQDIETGELVSAENVIKGTKKEPYHFDPENKYFATSLDAVLAEGNIPPAKTALEFYLSFEKLRKYIDDNFPKNLKTIALAAGDLDYKYLQTESAKTLGCDPSYNCWTGEEMRPEYKGGNTYGAGLHIHVGYENSTNETNIEIIKAMDLFLGIPSVLMEPKNKRRSTGYGMAGSYRHQPYGGVEFRSLSSYFSSGKDLIQWCFHNTQKAIEFVNSGNIEKIANLGDIIQQTINNEDKALAEHFCKEFNIDLV